MKITLKKTTAILFSSVICFALLRFLQLYFCIDSYSGFFKEGFVFSATEISIIIFLFMVIASLFAKTEKKVPREYPKTTLSLSIGYLILSGFLVADLIFLPKQFPTVMWQSTLFYFFGILTIILFLLKAISFFFEIPFLNEIPFKILSILPLLFWILRTVICFSFYSGIATLSENIFFVSGFLGVMFLILYTVFLINDFEMVKTSKRILGTFVFALLSCVNCCIAQFIIVLIKKSFLLHELNINHFTFLGILIFLFILYFNLFSEKNLKENVKKHKKEFQLFKH